jgi:hypothetical protein
MGVKRSGVGEIHRRCGAKLRRHRSGWRRRRQHAPRDRARSLYRADWARPPVDHGPPPTLARHQEGDSGGPG